MGRITVFSKDGCHFCIRAKRELQYRCLPFVEISLGHFPHRREDMMSLSGRLTVPQIFFNDTCIGGCEDLMALLSQWDAQEEDENNLIASEKEEHDSVAAEILKNKRTWRKYQQEIASQPDPTDPRLALPAPLAVEDDELGQSNDSLPNHKSEDVGVEADFGCINLPDGTCASIREVTNDLVQHMPRQKLAYLAKFYSDCFQGDKGVDALLKMYPFERPGDNCTEEEVRAKAVKFGLVLQQYGILHHVSNEHAFQDTGAYYYRLQPFHQPNILNSFQSLHRVIENMPSDKEIPASFLKLAEGQSYSFPLVLTPAGALQLLVRLQKVLDRIEERNTGRDGVDYLSCKNYEDPDYLLLEEESCQLQCMDAVALASTMTNAEKMVFGIHLYNIMVRHATMKLGVPLQAKQRGSFFTGVCYNVANQILSLDDVEHGIIRANTRHPYHLHKQFIGDDPRRAWAVSELDPRIHFTLFCGANSCPPINSYTVDDLDNELQLAAEAFCHEDGNVALDEENFCIHLSMLFKWYRNDFGAPKDRDLLAKILTYLRKEGDKYKALLRMIQGETDSFQAQSPSSRRRCSTNRRKDLKIKYIPYDWGSKAAPGKCLEFKSGVLKNRVVSVKAPFNNQPDTLRFGGGCVPAT